MSRRTSSFLNAPPASRTCSTPWRLLYSLRHCYLFFFFQALTELRALNPERHFNLILIDVTKDELILERSSRVKNLLYPLETVLDDSIGCAVWFAARGKGRRLGPDGNLEAEEYQSPARVLLLGKKDLQYFFLDCMAQQGNSHD